MSTAKGKGKSSVEVALIDRDGAPLKMSIKGKSVCISLVLLANNSKLEELQNLWNDAQVVSELSDEGQTMARQVPPSNRESHSLQKTERTENLFGGRKYIFRILSQPMRPCTSGCILG
jgi:hypothetical protein